GKGLPAPPIGPGHLRHSTAISLVFQAAEVMKEDSRACNRTPPASALAPRILFLPWTVRPLVRRARQVPLRRPRGNNAWETPGSRGQTSCLLGLAGKEILEPNQVSEPCFRGSRATLSRLQPPPKAC